MKTTHLLLLLPFLIGACAENNPPATQSSDGLMHYREATPQEVSAMDAYYHFTVKGVRYNISRPGMLYQPQHMVVYTPPHSMTTIYGKLIHNGSSITFTADNGKIFTFKIPN